MDYLDLIMRTKRPDLVKSKEENQSSRIIGDEYKFFFINSEQFEEFKHDKGFHVVDIDNM